MDCSSDTREAEDLKTYRLFGVNLATCFSFASCLRRADGPADLVFSLDFLPPVSRRDWETWPPVYASPQQSADGESIAYLYRTAELEVLRFPRLADFYVAPSQIDCHLWQADREDLMEIRLLGSVLSYWFERRGILTLHGSAVAVGERAVIFLSSNGGGKSGLAAEMMRTGSAELLADDIAALEAQGNDFLVHPAYPQMRMWPDEAERFLRRWDHLSRVHPDLSKRRVPIGPQGFGTFHDASSPLACIYLATRVEGADAVQIQPVSRSEALIELVRHSFSPRLVEAAGLQPARLDLLARLVRTVPVRRLVYPSGFERLGEVASQILRAD